MAETVCELHAAGVLIALDDFGTGCASLANLRQFPVDRPKIDKSFVQNAEDDAIVRAVINLGASMGMKVVAVEAGGLWATKIITKPLVIHDLGQKVRELLDCRS